MKKVEKTRLEINATNKLGDIAPPLLAWYAGNARALPWRENTDPYRVWVSEIMLQQTQVETVIPYYNRFIREIPGIEALAAVGEERLLKLWEGLGYYSRARNLQKAARVIVEKYGGRFPKAYGDILSLPGVGKYTAGAIASICFGEPIPAVDGNVLRVVARLIGYDGDISAAAAKNHIAGMLGEIYPAAHSGDFTQSLMELGATVCLPKSPPRCDACPIAFSCAAYRTGTQMALPVKGKKNPRKKELKTVFLLLCGDKIAIRRRPAGTLLGGLWEFPNTAGNVTPEQAKTVLANWGISALAVRGGVHKKHTFTHVEWEMTGYAVACENMVPEFLWVTKEKLTGEVALPSAFRPFLSAAGQGEIFAGFKKG